MNADIIQNIWDKTQYQKKDIFYEVSEKLIKPGINKQSLVIKINLVFTIIILTCAEIFCVLNLFSYAGNNIMMYIHGGFTITALLFIIYCIHLLRKHNSVESVDKSLADLLEQQYDFFSRDFEFWNIIIAISLLIAVFAVNTFVDNQDGYYTVNNIYHYALLNIFVFIFAYTFFKLSLRLIVKEIKIYLEDLNKQIFDDTIAWETKKRKNKFLTILLLVFCTMLLLLFVWISIP